MFFHPSFFTSHSDSSSSSSSSSSVHSHSDSSSSSDSIGGLSLFLASIINLFSFSKSLTLHTGTGGDIGGGGGLNIGGGGGFDFGGGSTTVTVSPRLLMIGVLIVALFSSSGITFDFSSSVLMLTKSTLSFGIFSS